MKSLDELNKLHDEAKKNMVLRSEDEPDFKVVVGMGTVGISAGARDILLAMLEEVANNNLSVIVLQSGIIPSTGHEPIVEVYDKDSNKTIYGDVDIDKCKEIVQSHLMNNKIIDEYTIDKIGGK